MVKVFLKDVFDRNTLVKSFITVVLIYMGMDFLIKQDPNLLMIIFDSRLMVYLSFALLTTIYYFAKTYTTKENTLMYYQLPIDREKINFSFLICIIIETTIRKALPLAVVAYLFKAPLEFYISLILVIPLLSIIGSIPQGSNQKREDKVKLLFINLLILAAIIYLFYEVNISLLLKLAISIALLLALAKILNDYFYKNLIFSQDETGFSKKIKLSNYFLKFILAENVYLINTLGIIAMIVFISIIMPAPMKIPLALAIATINTPLLTIFSTDNGVLTYKKMLPNKYKSLDKDYLLVLFAYLAIVHLLILILNISDLSIKLILLLIIFTIFDTLFAYFLEEKYPILNKKTTMEVWKHPRKFIMGIIVFLISFIVFGI